MKWATELPVPEDFMTGERAEETLAPVAQGKLGNADREQKSDDDLGWS